MKVRLLEDAEERRPGTVVDVDEAEAKRLLESGAAEPVAEKQTDQRETR